MTGSELVVAFIFMAFAVTTILVVGTLGAAGLLHRPRRRPEAVEISDSNGRDRPEAEHQANATKAQSDLHPEARARYADMVDSFMAPGADPSLARHPTNSTAVDPSIDHEDPPHGRAA